MAAGKGGGRAAAARSEGRAKTHTWRGLKLQLPPVAPPLQIARRVAERTGDDLKFIEVFLSEEQMLEVEEKLSELSFAEVEEELAALFNAFLKKYGVTLGES